MELSPDTLADLSLDGMDVCLPSQEEQSVKRAKALDNLSAYVKACGGSLAEGWDCALRFRITSRRHGRQGLTTDNYYYSPCGKTFRTHKQVVEFLGLEPVSKEQLREQQSQQQAQQQQSQQISIVSVTFLDGSCFPSQRRTNSTNSNGSKRSHSDMAATDSAADSTGCCLIAQDQDQQQQQHVSAASAPAALQGAMPAHSDDGQQQQHSPALSAPQAQPAAGVKRTKAALAAKYGAAAASLQTAATPATVTAVTAAPAAAAAAPSVMHSSYSSATVEAPTSSCQTEAPAATVEPAALPAPQQQQQEQTTPALPAASSNAGSTTTGSGLTSSAVTSRPAAGGAAAATPAQQRAPPKPQQQQQRRAVQPVPKWKPRQPTAWRVKLRELATKAAIEQGLIPNPASPATTSSCQPAASSANSV